MLASLLLGILVIGCTQEPQPAERVTDAPSPTAATQAVAVEPEERPMSHNVAVTWQLTQAEAGDRLEVAYQVRNTGDEPVLVTDQMIVFGPTEGYDRDPTAIIARADAEDPTLLRLVRGRQLPFGRPMIELYPGVRDLAPGAELAGTATVPLPLRSWHPNDRFRDLPARPTRAVLEVGILPADTETEEWPMNSGGTLRLPNPSSARTAQVLVGGQTLPVP